MFGGVGVAGADVFVLEGFQLLLGAEFVGLDEAGVSRSWRPEMEGGGESGHTMMVGVKAERRWMWWM